MTILDTIVARKREEVLEARKTVKIQRLEENEFFKRPCYSLKDFILDEKRTGIIAEFKKASPSKGTINSSASVTSVTKAYASAGASAISVLTDKDFFGGSKVDLIEARRVNQIPLLRKDFMIDEYQVVEAKSLGADIILLIAAILDPSDIKKLAAVAKDLDLNVLLEVHNKEELERSICDDLDAIGVNNRNLADFTVSLDHSYELINLIPDRFLKISESGISDPKVIRDLKSAGFNGFLIGENFMKTNDPGKAMQEFVARL